jgi:hypothetical protein
VLLGERVPIRIKTSFNPLTISSFSVSKHAVALAVRAQIVQKACMLLSGRFPGNPGLFVRGLCLRVLLLLLHSPQPELEFLNNLWGLGTE